MSGGNGNGRLTIRQPDLAPPLQVVNDVLRAVPVVGEPGAEDGRRRALRRLLLAADLIAGGAVGAAAAALSEVSLSGALVLAALTALVWPAIAYLCGLYAGAGLRAWVSGVDEAPRVLAASLLLSWPMYGAAGALHARNPALAGLSALPAMLAIATALRAIARGIAHSARPLRQRTVIVGSGLVAGQLARKLKASPHYGLDPIGLVDDEAHFVGLGELPWLGRLGDLSSILAEHAADRMIIAFSRASHQDLLHCVRAGRERGVAVDIVPRLFEFLDAACTVDHVGGMPLLSIGAPRLSPTSRFAKRTLDVVVSGIGLLVLAPLCALIALAIRVESSGPVIYWQMRAGRNRRPIAVPKFRSMYADADERKPELVNDLDDGVLFKVREDPRVTHVGRLLRRFSLDELPQLISVLRGDMSLVGPRPLIFKETNSFNEPWHERRLDLRPGLTGLWQVHGRSDVPFQEMVRLDYQYVTGWSLARDIEILLATVPAVLSGRGAY